MKYLSWKIFPFFISISFVIIFFSTGFSIPRDTVQIQEFIEKGNQYKSSSPDSAYYFFNKALLLAQQSENKKAEANVYDEIGVLRRSQGNYDTARIQFKKALKIYRELNDSSGIAGSTNNLGTVHFFQGNFKKAIEYYQQAMKLFNKLNDQGGVADCNNNIGLIHWRQKNYSRAEEYQLKAAEDYKELGNKTRQGYSLNNLGVIYGEQGEYEKSLEYYKKAASIFEESGQLNYAKSSYQNMGIVYKNLGQYKNAMRHYLKALDIAERLKDKNMRSTILGNVSELYKTLADSVAETADQRSYYLKRAIETGEQAIDYARDINALPLVNSNAMSLIEIYKAAGKINRALEVSQLHNELQDSLYNKEKTKAIEELEQQYQAEKKQLRIDKLEKEKALQAAKVKNQRILIIAFIAGIVLISLFSFVVYRQSRRNKKAYKLVKEQNEEIENQKESISRQADELRKLDATKNKFFSIIAHDLKNPFNSLLGNSELMIEKWDNTQKGDLKEYVYDMHEASKRGYNLLENLLEWSRAQTGRLEINPTDLNLYDIVQQNIFLLQPNADMKSIQIKNNIDEDVYVYADQNSLTTIIRNLLSNAIKYSEHLGTIKIGYRLESDQVKIFIEDNGVGIPSRNHDKLFKIDESYSTKGTNSEKGTGLGLLLCKEFVEKNDGTIGFDSEQGKGTTFYITLPKGQENF
jgi:signal transduction histidine kinase